MKMLSVKSWIFVFLAVLAFIFGENTLKESSFFDENNFTASLHEAVLEEGPKEELWEGTGSTDLSLLENFGKTEEISVVFIDEKKKQEILDNIAEKLDIIKQQVLEMENQQILEQEDLLDEPEDELEDEQEDKNEENEKSQEYSNQPENNVCASVDVNTAQPEELDKIIGIGPATAQKIIAARPFCSLDDLTKVSGIGQATLDKIKEQGCAFASSSCAGGGGGGGSAPVIYPKILISEIQIEPIGQRFIELYNPNDSETSLTGWYLQRKTATGSDYQSCVTKTNFEGKKIGARGYFLIARENSLALADILVDDLVITQDNSFVLKNPNGEISDKVDLVATTSPGSGQSIGRIFLEGSEQDTDTDFSDFQLNQPTPRAQNIKWVESEPKDQTAPEASFALAPIQASLSFDVNFTLSDPISTVTPSGLESFVFRWKVDDGEWNEGPEETFLGSPLSVDLIKTVSGSDGQVFYFGAKAKDTAGSQSQWLPDPPAQTKIELPKAVKNILINEIQIEGETTKEDWIELYNPNDFEIFLGDYRGGYLRLVKRSKESVGDTTIKSWSTNNGVKIPANGFYLWASSSNEAFPDLINADASTKQNISDNNGVALRLGPEDEGEIIDAVGWGDFSNVLFEKQAFSSNSGPQKSISRIGMSDSDDNSLDFIILDSPSPRAP